MMKGYTGKLLRVNLSNGKILKEEISDPMKRDFMGGRGFAVKLLWDEVKHVDPLSEKNKIIFSTGPLTGQPLPSSGKMVVASKSPLTGGYGDGNIGTMASVHLRKAGYDVMVVEGKSGKPSYLLIENESVKIMDASELWGKNTFEAQDVLEKKHGRNSGILLIGPAGENLIHISVVMSQRGRAGGRPGNRMGTWLNSYTLQRCGVMIEASYASAGPIRFSWNPPSRDDPGNRRTAPLSGRERPPQLSLSHL